MNGILEELDRAAIIVPLSRTSDVHFASVALEMNSSGKRLRIAGASVGFNAKTTLEKSKSELYERVAHAHWVDRGCPIQPATSFQEASVVVDDPQSPATAATGLTSDGSGYCAGNERETALTHGLLEVLERDGIVRVFDREETVHVEAVRDERLLRLLRDQRAFADVFSYSPAGLPPTAIAVVSSLDGRNGAVGTACRRDFGSAIEKSIFEGIMMLTTVRHTSRSGSVHSNYRDIMWASEHIQQLTEELRRKCTPRTATRDTHVGLLDAVRARFGEPVCRSFPVPGLPPSRSVWRVHVPGALSPDLATRRPWPIG